MGYKVIPITVNASGDGRRAVVDRGCTIPDGMVIGEDPEQDASRFHRSPNGITLVTAEMLSKITA